MSDLYVVAPPIGELPKFKTRGSAIAEEPRDGRFLSELLTRSSANPEEPCEHNVSRNRVNAAQLFDGLHVKRLQPVKSFKVTAVATI